MQQILQLIGNADQTSFKPFPSLVFALLFIHSSHPMVRCYNKNTACTLCIHLITQGKSNLLFLRFVMRMAGLQVPSLAQVKSFKLPGFVSPARVCFLCFHALMFVLIICQHLSPQKLPFYYISISSVISHCLGTPKIASRLIHYPVESTTIYT